MKPTTKMRTTNNARFSILFLFVILTLPLVGCNEGDGTGGDAGSGNEEVLVAANLPLSGNLASYGQPIQEGIQIALSDLNADSIKGPTINFAWKDNAGSPKQAVSVMQQQLLQSPDIYVSGLNPQVMAIEDQISKRGLPHFVWMFDIKINQDTTANNFRTWVNFKSSLPNYRQYAEKIDPQRAAIVHVNLPLAREAYKQRLAPTLRERGMEVFIEAFSTKKRDFKDLAVKLDNFDPDYIVINGFANQLVALVRAMRPLGLINNGNTLASFDMLDAAETLGPEALEGIRVNTPTFTLRPDRERVAKWRNRFKEQYGKNPSYTHAFAYDMTHIIQNTAKRLNLPANSDQWISALRKTDIQGITGPLRFDESGSLITPIEIGVYRNGELVPDTTISTRTPNATAAAR